MGPMRGGYSNMPKRQVSKETKRRVVATFHPYKKEVAVIVITVLAASILGLFPPFFVRDIINNGLLKNNLHVVTVFTLLALLITIVSMGLNLLYGYLSVEVGQRIMRDLRNRLYEHLQGMSLRFFTSSRTGEIQSRLSNDVAGVQSVVSDTAASILSNITTVVSTLIAMFYLDWRLSLLSVGILPIFGALSRSVGEYSRSVRSKVQESLADLTSTMQETLSVSGILLVKVSGRQALSLKRFTDQNERLTGLSVQQTMVVRLFFTLVRLSFSLTPALVYWLAGYLSIKGVGAHISIGTIVAFTGLQSGLFFPLTNLLNTGVDVSSSFALFDRIFEYLDMKQEIIDPPGATVLSAETARGTVEFENVSFRYDASQEKPTLDCVSLKANPGELVALVGPSGAGKTTLAYMIPRLYDVDSGCVRVENVDVRQVTLTSLAQVVGMVTQETYLLHDTILANLSYGCPDATEEEVMAAAKAAAIHERIMAMPEGYHTVVGERGYKLSGGEKQRIAIARALLKDPRILILDEATASLDTQSERQIQSALSSLMTGRTTIAIAHRLSTIRAADQILVVEGGRIVERGTHSELLEAKGAYAELYAAQFAGDHEESYVEEEAEPNEFVLAAE